MDRSASIAVRQAELSDASALIRLFQIVHDTHVRHEPEQFRPTDGSEIGRRIAELMADEQVQVFVATVEETVVGYLVASLQERTGNPLQPARRFLEIDQICVESVHRNRRAGRALMLAAESYAVARDVEDLQLNTWSFNEGGQAFFSRLGFESKVLRMAKRVRNNAQPSSPKQPPP